MVWILKLWIGYLTLGMLLVSAIKIISHDGACKVTTDQGGIDLSSLCNTDGSPRFQNINNPSNYYISYAYNPCQDFSETGRLGSGCLNVAVCEVTNRFGTQYASMGNTKSAEWGVSQDKNITITYSDGNLGFSSVIKLFCSEDSKDDTVTLSDTPDPDHPSSPTLVLRSKHCCAMPLPTQSPASGGTGISVGTILCIMLAAVVCLYIAGGIAFTAGYKKKEGREIIPNIGLWSGLPGLIKDGARFIFCRWKTSGAKYDQI